MNLVFTAAVMLSETVSAYYSHALLVFDNHT